MKQDFQLSMNCVSANVIQNKNKIIVNVGVNVKN